MGRYWEGEGASHITTPWSAITWEMMMMMWNVSTQKLERCAGGLRSASINYPRRRDIVCIWVTKVCRVMRYDVEQESCAIAKMTAQCALHMGALEIFGTA